MDTKHTPGPWKLGAAYGHFGVYIEGPKGENIGHAQIEEPSTKEGAKYGDKKPIPWGLPNARLIAAAPEMLNALAALEDGVRLVIAGLMKKEALEAECADARAAIIKATGGAA